MYIYVYIFSNIISAIIDLTTIPTFLKITLKSNKNIWRELGVSWENRNYGFR